MCRAFCVGSCIVSPISSGWRSAPRTPHIVPDLISCAAIFSIDQRHSEPAFINYVILWDRCDPFLRIFLLTYPRWYCGIDLRKKRERKQCIKKRNTLQADIKLYYLQWEKLRASGKMLNWKTRCKTISAQSRAGKHIRIYPYIHCICVHTYIFTYVYCMNVAVWRHRVLHSCYIYRANSRNHNW